MTDLNFSPWDTRYRQSLPVELSEEAWTAAQVQVEAAWLETLMEAGLCPQMPRTELDKLWAEVTRGEVEAVESRTQHATRALVEVLEQRLVKAGFEAQARWVHVGLTSFDTVDTANRFRLKKYFLSSASPLLDRCEAALKTWAERTSQTQQVGRTHGQWAVPNLLGLLFAEAAERIQVLRVGLKQDVSELRGQASGAVGGYQAPALLFTDPLKTEEQFLMRLGLKPHLGSTQILPPEDILQVAHRYSMIAGVIAKLAGDLRHLARSEIAEVSEGMSAGQVGSSTMPQKRNPWNLEHVCSLHKVVIRSRLALDLDLVSEHQRDLTNSASGRFAMEVFMATHAMLDRMVKILEKLQVHESSLKRHLSSAGTSVLAEAYYVLGTLAGLEHAHDTVRKAARTAESSGENLGDVLRRQGWLKVSDDEIIERLMQGPRRKMEFLKQRLGI
jgi:adenylosuccinate lyase